VFFFAVENAGLFEQAKGLFENNVINWLILVAGLVYLWNKNVPAMFKSREDNIQTAIKDAALAKKQGQDLLEEQKKRTANADAERAQILTDAKHLAAQLKEQLEAQAKEDAAYLLKKIDQQISNERQLAVTQLRQAAAAASIKLTEQILPSLLDEQSKAKLLTQFMEQLDSMSAPGQTFSANSLETSRK
jgi:F-type H+-transporting ATPase subunit b